MSQVYETLIRGERHQIDDFGLRADKDFLIYSWTRAERHAVVRDLVIVCLFGVYQATTCMPPFSTLSKSMKVESNTALCILVQR